MQDSKDASAKNVIISISGNEWSYDPPSPWSFTKAGKIRFVLGDGYALVGMSFSNPQSAAQGGLNKYTVRLNENHASELTLTDEDLASGDFEFIFVATSSSGKTLLSPDPVIVNRPWPPAA